MRRVEAEYLQFNFFGDELLLELLDGDIPLLQSVHGLLHFWLLLIQLLLHVFYLICYLLYFLLGLLGFLVGASSGNFCILEVGLQLIVSRFQLWLCLLFFGLSCPLLLLHVRELIEQLSVICLGHARSSILLGSNVCHLWRRSRHRALALVQVSVGASHRLGRLETHFDPGTLILALIKVDAMDAEILIVKLSQV